MTRYQIIEQVQRQIYGGYASDDATITFELINQYLDSGIALAAKKNYTDNYQLEGVGFINNSFYSTFKGLAITKDEQFLWRFTLPQLPIGIGSVDGISRVVFKDDQNNVSFPAVLLSESQVGIQRSMRAIPNKILCYPEGIYCYVISTIIMSEYTASATLISGGDGTDLDSMINIPGDYINVIVEYIKAQLSFERQQPVDSANDGASQVRTA